MVVKNRVKKWFLATRKQQSREKSRALTKLQGKVQGLIKEAMNGQEVKQELHEAKQTVENWFRDREQGHIFLAHALWVGQRETWGKYFEKQVQKGKGEVGKLKTGEGLWLEKEGVLGEIGGDYSFL